LLLKGLASAPENINSLSLRCCRRHWTKPWSPAGLKARIGSFKLSTVVQRVAVLSTAHKLKRLVNPCELPSVRTLLSRARRAAVKRDECPTKKTAITRAELEAMLATCDDSLEGRRDRALLCFGFASGGRRRSEIAAADMRDLRKVGEDGYICRLEYSKTQQAGEGGFDAGQANLGTQC
jgi:integrase